MTKLTDTLKQALNALASADAGEYLTLAQKTAWLNRRLDRAESAPVRVAPVQTEDKVMTDRATRRLALYMGSELPADMMNYVLQTCTRLKHDLTVLTFQSERDARALLAPFQDTLTAEGIDLRLVTLSGDPVPGLSRYLRSHPEIAFLACRETGYLGRSFLYGTQRKNVLPVPVLLVESHAQAETKPVPAQQDDGRPDKATAA